MNAQIRLFAYNEIKDLCVSFYLVPSLVVRDR